ncbi:MAG: hypothetical protein V5A20_07220 [Salinibacter sp.]|jgi:hypothetical protein|uniref:hypothetical protein n=1 Tax=Salinibacter sp. TaxID=2065818 RepID=UPI002FC335B1
MPTTRAKKRTAPEIIRDRLGDRLSGLYVVTRDPVSGERYDPFGLVAVVEMDLEKAYQVGSELSTELIENGVEVPFTAEPRDEVSLSEEVVEI